MQGFLYKNIPFDPAFDRSIPGVNIALYVTAFA